jgi:predicted phosphoribosyltransferase/dienelactone hydrolase
MKFQDRIAAGHQLAHALAAYQGRKPLILAIPRGAVPMGRALADDLQGELDVVMVRKIGAPYNPEFALGAVDESGWVYRNPWAGDDAATLAYIEAERLVQLAVIRKRRAQYTPGRRPVDPDGRIVIVVDDGLATGSTAAAAVTVVRHFGATHVTLAVPVGSSEAVERLSAMADEVVCLETPEPFYAVGQHYREFGQASDDEVVAILEAHPRCRDRAVDVAKVDEDVTIAFAGMALPGHLSVPAGAQGIVLFAHGSGSSQLSPRNVAVAKVLQGAGLGTLLFDLLTDDEADVRTNVFDIELLAERLVQATRWLRRREDVGSLPRGYFGASTGAAAALVAAAQCPDDVAVVVSRGGRPDLAGGWLEKVQAPTLLIVGSHDYAVIDLNRDAQHHLRCTNLLEIVAGATHLFEEPGTLAQAARLAQSWFLTHLVV